MSWIIKALLLPACAALLNPAPARAQPEPQGPVLAFEQTSAPHTEEVLAGGGVRKSPCVGQFSEQPTLSLHYQGSAALIVTGASDHDTTLAIRAPDNLLHCDDDSGGAGNPQISFNPPQAGVYTVWMGRYGRSTETAPATVRVSALQFPTGQAPQAEERLRAGFGRRVATVRLGEEGGIRLRDVLSSDCPGSVSGAPSMRLEYQTAGRRDNSLIIRVRAAYDEETGEPPPDPTLAVQAPDRSWRCNDDWDRLDPSIEFKNPRRGAYLIYAGVWPGSPASSARLELLEFDEPDPNATPALGRLSLDAALARGRFELNAGGPIDAALGVRNAHNTCAGLIGEHPHLVIEAPAGGAFTLRVDSATDTTLVVHAPDGRWSCDDDAGAGAFNPALRIQAAQAGAYSVFVGNYDAVRVYRRRGFEELAADLYVSRD